MPQFAPLTTNGIDGDHLHDASNEWFPSGTNLSVVSGALHLPKRPPQLPAETAKIRSSAPYTAFPTPVSLAPVKSMLQRSDSERRQNLYPAELCQNKRRTRSIASSAVKPKAPTARRSFPELRGMRINAQMVKIDSGKSSTDANNAKAQNETAIDNSIASNVPPSPLSQNHCKSPASKVNEELESFSDVLNDSVLMAKIETEWVLNLSMHFRDGTPREKFFITYIEDSNRWRKVTVSCDYRDASEDSLESDLQLLHYQRDKNARIYMAIRDSLPDIQFYTTVTNLKLQTSEGRLHVHVTEDVNEITDYPKIDLIRHLRFQRDGLLEVTESDVFFEAHLSGFVYRVAIGESVYVKKEISSPDTVDEFLYELNALAALKHSVGVIRLAGVVLDDSFPQIKGLLIEWASGGSLADYLFKHTDRNVPWRQRLKWAEQIISGINDIHESGFIQGDCTISNIVLDADDNAKIVDINRRGCPIGWEPPEFEGMIRSGQLLSLHIGVKSDLFQLGMILWAIAKQTDEPEREEKPLRDDDIEAPLFYREIVHSCLAENPAHRMPAKQLLERLQIAVGEEFDPSFELDGLAPLYNRPPSPFSAADMEEMEKDKRLQADHEPNQASAHRDFITSNNVLPDYKLQDSLLAGIGRFEERNQPREDSETPMIAETSSHHPIHQDSGFDLPTPEEKVEDSTRFDTDQLKGDHGKHDNHRSASTYNFSPMPPLHQDSGFHDSILATQRSCAPDGLNFGNSKSLNSSSGPNHAQEYLLMGLGAHATPKDESSLTRKTDTNS